MKKESFADKIKEVELFISGSKLSLQTKFPEPNKKFTSSFYNVYCHNDAIPHIEFGDTSILAWEGFKWYEIKLFYDYKRNPAMGTIRLTETVLTRMESDLWSCPDCREFERILPPLKDGYPLHCKICSSEMVIIQKAPMPLLREKVESLPEYVEVRDGVWEKEKEMETRRNLPNQNISPESSKQTA